MEDYNYESDWIKKQSNKIRKIVTAGLPKGRPLWFPHYFWHWLHSAPHFHILRHNRRVPWKASSAKMMDGMDEPQDLNSAKMLDYNFYQYGDSTDVDYDEIYDEDMDENDMDIYDENMEENDMDFDEIYEENDMGIYDENDMDFEQNDMYFDGIYDGYMDDGLVMNALENGNDFIGKEDDINNEMWRIETMFLFMIISILFCILTFCFVWRSKWGALIRKLNQQRINRNKMMYDAKIRMDVLNGMSNDNEDESSSLNISDVAPLNN